MMRQLSITGKNSNEIYTLLYPNNLINFCKYDFTLFLNHCTDLCRIAHRTGEYSIEDVYSIRNSISGCHKYYEQNMRLKFEKIVIDCWIDYLCKQNEIGVTTLWQSFMRCGNDFEKAVFARLSEYRHNRAINEWVNLLKLQEYARTKVEFVFGTDLSGPSEASNRANYFDLMFNVAANEQGFPIDEIGSSDIYSIGRMPNSPFVLQNASKEILRGVLKDMNYSDRVYKAKNNPDLSDRTAMDAFSVIKSYIPDKNDSLANTIIKSMSGMPSKVYVPSSFKAVIDLEIDAIIESGAVLRQCPRCGEYYLKDEEYPYNYCNNPDKNGVVCLDVMNAGAAPAAKAAFTAAPEIITLEPKNEPMDKGYVNEQIEKLYKEMAQRVNVDLTQRDFSRWYQAALRLKEKLLTGMAGQEELDDFFELSRGDEFASRKQQTPPPPEPVELTESGKEIKKFVFERVERPVAQPKAQPSPQSEQAAIDAVKRLFGQEIPAPRPQQNYYQQPPQYPQPRTTTKIIRGGGQGKSFTESPFERMKSKTVVIPNGEPEKPPMVYAPPPVQKIPSPAPNVRETEPVFASPFASAQAPAEEDVKVFRTKKEIEDDVKVFVPRKPAFNAYIEPSPYEKIKQPLQDYRRSREEEAEEQIEGQISAEEIEAPVQPIPSAAPAASAKAISAYRTITLPKIEPQSDRNRGEKADFSEILESMNRSDGFASDEEALNADGLPVSHKTQHVMNALFASPKASPFLRINLDDDDD
ncbi:MAG: hypothetical protein IJY73_10540 [Oscillospiraceae bacterium]|nr:hypothetical protein [Oscillospiraceae bacterium]